MSLIVFSPSTEKYIIGWDFNEKLLITSIPSIELLKYPKIDKQVIAIGGGSVIDTAKVISKRSVIAVPTTFSGVSRTSHAVLWDCKNNQKVDVKTSKPKTIIIPDYFNVMHDSIYDCYAHLIESGLSKNATAQSLALVDKASGFGEQETLEGNIQMSLLAGDAIEITGTNILHALSYPLTLNYGIPHARALRYLLYKDFSLTFDVDKVVDAALKYIKLYSFKAEITNELLRSILLW